jgi:hypothetical protein
MQLHLTVPLCVRTISGHPLELLPVVMTTRPSTERETNPAQWMHFLDIPGEAFPLSEGEAAKVESYMRSNGTDAISEDGIKAFALAEGRLVPCNCELEESALSPSGLY